MSATVQTRVVDIDRLIPRVVSKDREENDVKLLLPWVYKQINVARGTDLFDWPDGIMNFASCSRSSSLTRLLLPTKHIAPLALQHPEGRLCCPE
ncbi:hypothetical protein BDQ94DRAFT_133725 [Aspergillus welwitschiae]|uniref:Uncharacterized protein n=1 Tax=Aspergillus welwitschiae TaxID=1341132 RepID=A0A3F3QGP7_9EURO|nr:hypothetical protein BDQ94DRAFT_133725 [Aspergillus welwitschiae]RDH38341.1 hypothetical protein BDQ94DRAFT_133725 [Aspergillus welwitschiae]